MLVPDQDFVNFRVVAEQFVVSFAQQEINLSMGIVSLELSDNGSCKHDVAYEGRLDDKNTIELHADCQR